MTDPKSFYAETMEHDFTVWPSDRLEIRKDDLTEILNMPGRSEERREQINREIGHITFELYCRRFDIPREAI